MLILNNTLSNTSNSCLIISFCFPTIKFSKVPLIKSGRVLKVFPKETLSAIEGQFGELLKMANEKRQGFFPLFALIEYTESTKQAKLCESFKPLLEESKEGITHYIVYIDPTNGYPSVILKNIIGAIAMNLKEDKKQLRFISIRDKIQIGRAHV